MKKPSPTQIRSAEALSLRKGTLITRGIHPVTVCTICGEPSEQLGVWREHDERDRPIAGPLALVFIGHDHEACIKTMENHPRLYAEEMGEPGYFPRLCGDCVQRDGWRCLAPELKANGGPGLNVGLSDPFRGAIICSRDGCIRPLKRALSCVGQKLRSDRPVSE